MGKATFVQKLEGFSGQAYLYHVDPPIEARLIDWDGDERVHDYRFDFVVVSATVVFGRPETFIFGADENGRVVSFNELQGSLRDVYDHKAALKAAGYEVDYGGNHEG